MRLAALLLTSLFLSTLAHAQSITSFAPDTTLKAAQAHTPPDEVDIPVWLGIQFAPIPGVTSKLQTQERTDAQNCTPWIGVGAAWPWAKPRETWLEAGYQHWEFAGTFKQEATVSGDTLLVPIIDPITLDQFTARFGVDQWFWQPKRVSAVVGAGIGIGTGWTQAPSVVESNVLFSTEFVGRALVSIKLSPRVRLGLGATGSVAYVSGGSVVNGWWQHLEFVLKLEQSMRLPKRIVPGL
jgi:hypothetical protein